MTEFSTWRSLVDGEVISAIPDIENLQIHIDFSTEDGSMPVSDQSGNENNLTQGSYSGVGSTINGKQAGEFDRSEDDGIGEPFEDLGFQDGDGLTIHLVWNGDSQDHVLPFIIDYDSAGGGGLLELNHDGGPNEFGTTNDISGGDTANTPSVITIEVTDDDNTTIRQDKAEIASGGTRVFENDDDDGLTLGIESFRRGFDGNRSTGKFGELVVYTGIDSERRDEVEHLLIDRWDIST